MTRVHDWIALQSQRYASDAPAQQALVRLHQQSATAPLSGPLWQHGFSRYSQTDEDGILLYLFSVLGAPSRRAVEICAGDGLECNAANLVLNHGWDALLVDGDPANVERGQRFFSKAKQTYVYPPRFVQAWITRDSVDDLIKSNGFDGEIDLLSLDLDGVDYWIWDAITAVTPRVVVVEYQDILGPDRVWTVPYADDFSADSHPATGEMPNFAGASLAAFVQLGRAKGYRLVGVNRLGFNAFFVRDDIGQDILPEVPISVGFEHPKNAEGMRDRFPTVERLPWHDLAK